jgi:hypothetical protein
MSLNLGNILNGIGNFVSNITNIPNDIASVLQMGGVLDKPITYSMPQVSVQQPNPSAYTVPDLSYFGGGGYGGGSSNTSTSGGSPKSVQDLINMGYGGYAGWNNADALADFAKTGGAGKGGVNSGGSGNPMQDVNNMIQNSFQTLMTQVQQKFGDYQASHPFALDQVLADATNQAKEQVDPYYQEELGNYLTGVQRTISRSGQDTQNLLGELNAQAGSFSRDTNLKLNSALENSNAGYANAGLFNSGAALRSGGMLQTESANSLSDYMRQNAYEQNQANLQNQRTVEDTNLASTQTQRDIARQQYTDEQSRANQIAQEAGQTYVRGFQATLPPQLQANNNFDLVSQLGIPSSVSG